MSRTLQIISADQREEYDFILKVTNSETSNEREHDRYESKFELDQAISDLKSNGSLSDDEEIVTEYIGPEVLVEDIWISRQDGTGDLILTAQFQVYDDEGDVTFNNSADEYVDADSGQIDTYSTGLMRTETQWGYFDVNKVHEAINEFLYENPINESILDKARDHAEWSVEFEESQLRPGREGDHLAVVDASVFPLEDGVHVSFNVITKAKQDGDDFPTYSKSSTYYEEFDGETGSLKVSTDLEKEYSFNSEDIKRQLSEYLAQPDTQSVIEKITNEHLENKRVNSETLNDNQKDHYAEMAENTEYAQYQNGLRQTHPELKNGDVKLLKIEEGSFDYKLESEAKFVFKRDDRYQEMIVINNIDIDTGECLFKDDFRYNATDAGIREKVKAAILNHYESNPVSVDLLYAFREDAMEQLELADKFAGYKKSYGSDVVVSDVTFSVTPDKDVVANFNIIDHQLYGERNEEHRYTEYFNLSEKIDLDNKRIVHMSQSDLDYDEYDHQKVRSELNSHIKDNDLLNDKEVLKLKMLVKINDHAKEAESARYVAS